MLRFIKNIVDRILPNANERQRIKADQANENRNISKADNNAASWRNGIGWVCVIGMLYQLIVRELLIFGANNGYYILITEPPNIDSKLWSLLFGMLGIADF